MKINDFLRHIITSFLVTAIAVMSPSCSDDDGPAVETVPDDHDAVLTFDVPFEGTRSRAYDDLDEEFQVDDMILYFFAADGFDEATSPCLYRWHMPSDKRFNGINDGRQTLSFAFPMDVKAALFPAGAAQAVVYAVANSSVTLPDDQRAILQDAPSALTLSRLKSVISKAQFATGGDRLFLMDATATLPYSGGRLTGEIDLERLAARVTLRLRIPQSIKVKDVITDGTSQTVTERTFTPVDRGLHAWMTYGVDQASLDGNNDNVAFYSHTTNESSGVTFTKSGGIYERPLTDTTSVSAKTQDYLIDIPFYTYPHKWDPTQPFNNTYITLRVYWHGPGIDENGQPTAEQTQSTYYKIGVQASQAVIERNRSYDIGLTLGKLGGTEIQRPIEVSAEWNYDMPWNTKDFETSIKELRYLLLNNNDYDAELGMYVYRVNNLTDFKIPFSSSHPVEIYELNIEWDDMANNSTSLTPRSFNANLGSGTRVATYDNYVAANHLVGLSPDNTTQNLMFRRNFTNYSYPNSNSTTSESNITIQTDRQAPGPYTFTVKLRHNDAAGHDYTATVRIIQYPAIYVSRILSGNGTSVSEDNSRRFINGYKSAVSNPNNNKGWVGGSQSSSNTYWLGSIHNDNNVSNRNIYTIHITRFASLSDDYIIGDPRSREVDNMPVGSNDWSREGKDIANLPGGTKYLAHYYKANENSEYKRFIAPEFSVASQWGVTYDVTRDQARRRCASYQEQGKPAGRWRLPTTAEIEFIANLSCRGLIPYLFGTAGNSADYWTGTGGINVTNSSTPSVSDDSGTSHAVRCVYDDWYWKGDDCDPAQFTWGDRPRDLTRSAALLKNYRK